MLMGEIVCRRLQRSPAGQALTRSTQDLDLEDAPLAAMTHAPWQAVSALLDNDKKQSSQEAKTKEKVLLERSGFGEEGTEGDAY